MKEFLEWPSTLTEYLRFVNHAFGFLYRHLKWQISHNWSLYLVESYSTTDRHQLCAVASVWCLYALNHSYFVILKKDGQLKMQGPVRQQIPFRYSYMIFVVLLGKTKLANISLKSFQSRVPTLAFIIRRPWTLSTEVFFKIRQTERSITLAFFSCCVEEKRGYLESLGKDMKPNGQHYHLWIIWLACYSPMGVTILI